MGNRIKRLSKSQYLKGLQCPKALWLYRHRPDLAPPISEQKQWLFDSGHEVGTLAQAYFENFRFYRLDLIVYISDRLNDLRKDGYTLKEFSELISTSLDAVYDLDKDNLIESQPEPGCKTGRVISKEAAELFHETYITTTEMQNKLGINRDTIGKYLAREGTRPVHGPKIDGSSRYLYLRKDLKDFDFSKIKPSRRAKKPRHLHRQMMLDEAA